MTKVIDETTKEMTTAEENKIATGAPMSFGALKEVQTEVVGLDLDPSDMKLPKVKLMQATSQEATKSKGKILPGQFYNTVTQEATDTVECILLYLGKSMVKWKTPFKRGEEPLCRSFDGRLKADGDGDGNCQTCQYSSQNPKAWDLAKENGLSKPPCNQSYVWLAIDTKTNLPFRLIAAGASTGPTKDFLNRIAPLRVSPFMGVVTLSSVMQENESGSFYVIQYGDFTPNPKCFVDGVPSKEKVQEFEDLSKTYRDIFMTSIVQRDTIEVESTESADGAIF